jgi:hypothetical protein
MHDNWRSLHVHRWCSVICRSGKLFADQFIALAFVALKAFPLVFRRHLLNALSVQGLLIRVATSGGST